MGYAAVAVSASDLEAGVSFLQDTSTEGLPWVSANLELADTDLRIPSFISKTVGSLRIAITAITNPPSSNETFTVIDYNTVLPALLNDLSDQHDIIILLSNLSGTENKKLASQFSDIDILLSADRSLGKMAPTIIAKTLMTQTSSRGKYLGKLDIKWDGADIWSNDRLRPLSELQEKLVSLNNKIVRITEEDSGISPKKISRLKLQEKRLAAEIDTRLRQQSNQARHKINTHKLSFIPVQPTSKPDTIEAIVQSIEKKIRE